MALKLNEKSLIIEIIENIDPSKSKNFKRNQLEYISFNFNHFNKSSRVLIVR